jgi:septum formation protein
MDKKRNVAMKKIILASASPRRKQILKEAGVPYRTIPSHVSESYPASFKPAHVVRYLAIKKARHIAEKYPTETVLGADTLVYIKGEIIGKPKNKADAKRILTLLSGAWQRVYTGVAVVRKGEKQELSGVAVSYVKLRKLGENHIESAAKNHMDKAGAYAVQEKKDPFVEKIRGDYDNVVGLPMRLVKKLLRLADRRSRGSRSGRRRGR